MKSVLYTGHVAHARLTPKRHRLRYRVFMLALDLDELPSLGLRLLSHNRANLMAFNDHDHGARKALPLRPQIEAKLAKAGIAFDGGPITLLTMPALLGYVFNPLSVYFCWRRDGALAAIVYEVRNTFGEHHDYVLPTGSAGFHPAKEGQQDAGDPSIEQRCAKEFFVSPFMDMDMGYAFTIRAPGEDVLIGMQVKRGDDVVLTASFAGRRRALTDANLAREVLIDPLMTFKAMAGIHWEALKMLVKGHRYIGRGKAPLSARSTPI
ncbi:MAG: DUF1365 domain-containing protein [Pseudomonadota bacterium]